jgi:iron complex transport system ATP-binding protein
MKLAVEKLNLTIGDQQILKDISVQTAQGQFVGLIGSNGSGKSTLLKAFYNSLNPYCCEIYLCEMNILKSSEK